MNRKVLDIFCFFAIIGIVAISSANASISPNIITPDISTLKSGKDTLNTSDTVQYWKLGGFASLTINQMALAHWAKGGENSMSSVAILNLFAHYSREGITWENTLNLSYGLQESEEKPVRKNQDKIDFASKVGYRAMDNLYYSGLIGLKTQFMPGYKYPNDSVKVSKFMAPGYLIASLGMDFKPYDVISIYLSPATGRFIFTLDDKIADVGTFSSEPAEYDSTGMLINKGKKIKADFGAYLKAGFQMEVMKNISVNSQMELFNNFTDKNTENRDNVDVEWETMINMKVNEFISANIFVHMIYDHDVKIPLYFTNDQGVKTKYGEGRRLQVKELLGVGLSYKF